MAVDWQQSKDLQSFESIMALKLQVHEGKKTPGTYKELVVGFWREVSDLFQALETLQGQIHTASAEARVQDISDLRQVVAEEGADVANQVFLLVRQACIGLEDLAQLARHDYSSALSRPPRQPLRGENL